MAIPNFAGTPVYTSPLLTKEVKTPVPGSRVEQILAWNPCNDFPMSGVETSREPSDEVFIVAMGGQEYIVGNPATIQALRLATEWSGKHA